MGLVANDSVEEILDIPTGETAPVLDGETGPVYAGSVLFREHCCVALVIRLIILFNNLLLSKRMILTTKGVLGFWGFGVLGFRV